MVEIVKCYKESCPSLKFIGKRYTDKDRGADGGFGNKWGEWFSKSWFDEIEELGVAPENNDSYFGLMRRKGEFEYWIGMFFSENTSVPEGFQSVIVPAGDVGVCWIYGSEDNGEIYGLEPHNMCVAKIKESGWELQQDPWFFERYNCPRYTTRDEKGNVILDYGLYIIKTAVK
ncbi:MAG: hypothetical protein A2Y17_01650 [Clostridiales bacterium GWF2_38_85]|nr:MAG: hypothetical protein A2Y17_01650 [Clostridiales bacterium GWF2_38_85]HBL84786.1 AraC family transcriptional regulator [Clostridiales bacterium]